MALLSYYLAISLDGFIAKPDGNVDWLNAFEVKLTGPYSYENFYQTVDTVIMGRKTWDISRSFEETPFKEKKCFVVSKTLSKNKLPSYVELLTSFNHDFIKKLKQRAKEKIWIVGGANLSTQVLMMDELDEIVITIMPIMIGSGIKWLENFNVDKKFILKETHLEDGVVQIIYRKKND